MLNLFWGQPRVLFLNLQKPLNVMAVASVWNRFAKQQ